jgi:Ca2+-binding RTX toxin-like protein
MESPWSDGVEVTGTLGQDQMVVISIPSASKGVLSYYCTNHSGMGNDCDIIGNTIAGTDKIDVIYGLAGDDVISAGFGADMIYADAGDDTIVLSASDTYHSFYKAANRSSDLQTGTEERVSLKGMLKVEHSADGGFGTDTIKLDEGNIAYFLHDSYSDFYWQQSFATDTLGNTSAPRFFGIEKITGSDGNNIIDLTSPDYSLAEQSIEVDGGLGADIIWGSDANETIKGGDGDDELFGGAGTNVLTGGAGADEFQFTMTSENDSVTDFNAAEGDTLKFFNTGGATFDRDSVTANSEGDGISIEYSHNDQVQSLNISLGLSSSSVTNDLLSAIEII